MLLHKEKRKIKIRFKALKEIINMKIRTNYVSNSSSSSFVVDTKGLSELLIEKQFISLKQFKELVHQLCLDENFTISCYNSQNEIEEFLAYKTPNTSFQFNSFYFRERTTDLLHGFPFKNIISFLREKTNIIYYIINIQGEC